MLTLNKTDFFKRPVGLREKANARPLLPRINSMPKREEIVDRWLEYDLVALAMLVFGIAAVEFLALSF